MQANKMVVGKKYVIVVRKNPVTGTIMHGPGQTVEAELIKMNTTIKGQCHHFYSGRHQFRITGMNIPKSWIGKQVEVASNSVHHEASPVIPTTRTATKGQLVSTAQKRLAETKKEQKELKEELQAITHMLQRFGVTASGSLDQKMLQIDAEDLPKFRRLLIRVLGKQLEL